MKVWNQKVIIANTLMALLLTSLVTVMGSGSSLAAAATSEEDDEVSTSSDGLSAASGSNRFVVWQDGSSGGNSDIFFRRSTDSGATWQSIKNLSANPGNSFGPQIAVSGSNVYVIWTQLNADASLADVFFRGSTDNGVTWGSKIKISSSGTNTNFGTPHIATSGSNVYITWQDTGADDVFFRRSTDEGASWKSIVNLSDNTGQSSDPQVAASGSTVYVVWYDRTPGNYEILLERSNDGGGTWEDVQNISNNGGDSFDPQITVSDSYTYIVWRDSSTSASNTNILFSRSADDGETWDPSFDLSSDNKSNTDPLITVSGSNVYVVWVKRISSDGTEVYFRGSTNNGANWGSRIKISNSGTEVSITSHDIAASGSNVYISWSDDVSSDVYFRRSTDEGASWKARINISNTAGFSENTQIAALGSNVYIVWNDQTSGNRDILLKRSTNSGSTWKAVKNLSNNDGVSELPQIGV
ncbi:MAG TPA: sialidase family protein [Nitrososphaera sp.]|nr:sialidase family protein [Nitrososphaera sp.]